MAGAIEKGHSWSEPYFWEPWDATIISYSIPVFKNDQLLGVTGGELFFDQLQEQIAAIKVYDNGYMTLLDQNFNFLYHPNPDAKALEDVDEGALSFVKDAISAGQMTGIQSYKYKGEVYPVAWFQLANGWILTANPVESEMLAGLRTLNFISLAGAGIAILLAIVVGLILGNSLTKHIKNFMQRFQEGSHGDLTVRASIKTKDEMGVMAVEFNSFMDRLKDTITHVKGVIEQAVEDNIKISQMMDNVIKGSQSTYYGKATQIENGFDQL